MSEVAPAKFLSLDSSLLANLSRDYYSGNSTTRHEARKFVSLSLSAGWTPLICWHQLEELIRHPDDEIAAERVRFIRSLPALAWISTASAPKDVGSICDIFVCEDLKSEVAGIFRSTWTERAGRIVPNPENLRLGNDAATLDAIVLYADMSDSTDLVDHHQRSLLPRSTRRT